MMHCSRKLTGQIEWVGCSLTIISFLANIDQARLNLEGQKWSVFIPITILIACFVWMFYGVQKKDKPIIVSNIVGIIASILSITTYFI